MWQKILSGLGIVAILIAMAIGGGIGKQLGKSAFAPSKPTAQQVEEKLVEGFNKAAEQSNRLGPRMVDKDTRWDRTTVGPGARINYFYSFPNYSSQEITSSWLRTNLEPVVRNGVCTNNDMKLSLQYGGTYLYAYSGSDGAEIARFEFNERDCNLPSASTAREPPQAPRGKSASERAVQAVREYKAPKEQKKDTDVSALPHNVDPAPKMSRPRNTVSFSDLASDEQEAINILCRTTIPQTNPELTQCVGSELEKLAQSEHGSEEMRAWRRKVWSLLPDDVERYVRTSCKSRQELGIVSYSACLKEKFIEVTKK